MDITFRDLTMLTKWLRGLLLGQVPLAIVSFVADAYEETKPPSTETLDLVQAVIAATQVAAVLATFIIAGIWLYRSARNVRAFGAHDLAISPGWAIGWYFIPIANLFKPFQAMSEIWRASVDPAKWRELNVPIILRLWWGIWLVSNFFDLQIGKMAMGTDPIVPKMALSLVSAGLDAASDLVFFVVVGALWAIQKETGVRTTVDKIFSNA